MAESTSWMQGIGNVVQAVCAVVATSATVVIALAAHKFQSGQIRPLLALDVTNETRGTRVLLQNQGLGPAKIGKVTYRYRDDKREHKRADRIDDHQLREEKCIDSSTGLPSGDHRVYMMRAKEVDEDNIPDEENRMQALKQLVDVSNSNNCVETCIVAGQVLGAGGKELELFCVKVQDVPEAKQWLQKARNMLNGITVEIEYQDARGFTMQPNFQGTITMPRHPELPLSAKHLSLEADSKVSAPASKQQASAKRWSLLSSIFSLVLHNKHSSSEPVDVHETINQAVSAAARPASDGEPTGVAQDKMPRSTSMV